MLPCRQNYANVVALRRIDHFLFRGLGLESPSHWARVRGLERNLSLSTRGGVRSNNRFAPVGNKACAMTHIHTITYDWPESFKLPPHLAAAGTKQKSETGTGTAVFRAPPRARTHARQWRLPIPRNNRVPINPPSPPTCALPPSCTDCALPPVLAYCTLPLSNPYHTLPKTLFLLHRPRSGVTISLVEVGGDVACRQSNKANVQNPSMRLGHQSVLGFPTPSSPLILHVG